MLFRLNTAVVVTRWTSSLNSGKWLSPQIWTGDLVSCQYSNTTVATVLIAIEVSLDKICVEWGKQVRGSICAVTSLV